MTWVVHCWCAAGSTLIPFAGEYLRCTACDTLVCTRPPDASTAGVEDDAHDFYGSAYWAEHQAGFGFPPLERRARLDLSERCLYWLKTLLRYRRPEGSLLEIGASHGGFTRLTSMAGFDSTGVEMSPSVVEFARRAFDVDMRIGPFQSTRMADASFDVIASFDVLEHFSDPERVLREIRRLLRPDGTLLIQTPDFPCLSESDLIATSGRFLEQLRAPEHIYLFSKPAMRMILERTGFPSVVFEPPIFSYDMFFVAGAEDLTTIDVAEVERTLLARPDGRVVLAMLDLYRRNEEFAAVANERQAVIDTLKTACDERLTLIQQLDRQLRER